MTSHDHERRSERDRRHSPVVMVLRHSLWLDSFSKVTKTLAAPFGAPAKAVISALTFTSSSCRLTMSLANPAFIKNSWGKEEGRVQGLRARNEVTRAPQGTIPRRQADHPHRLA